MNKETVLHVTRKISLFYGDRALYCCDYSLLVSHIPHQVDTPGWHVLIEVLVAKLIAKLKL